MPRDRLKERLSARSIENHQTAAWANISMIKHESRVPIPSELEVRNAKEYVDTNQK